MDFYFQRKEYIGQALFLNCNDVLIEFLQCSDELTVQFRTYPGVVMPRNVLVKTGNINPKLINSNEHRTG